MILVRFADLTTVDLVCAHLQTTPHALRRFLLSPTDYYEKHVIPKRDGGKRVVYRVGAALKRVHRVLAVSLQPHVCRLGAHVQGFRAKRGIGTNAGRHKGAEYVVTADIRAFFDHVCFEQVLQVFKRLGCPHHAAILLSRISTHEGRLPQGGRASPALANLAARGLDKTLLALAPRAKYSRYADDLTFSGRLEHCPTEVQVADALEAHGFSLRPHSYKLQSRTSGQIVTGLSLAGKRPTLSRRKRRDVERTLYYAAKFGMESHLSKIESPVEPQHALGYLEGFILSTGAFDRPLMQRWLTLFAKTKL
jgi:RNA-directed DNA polymerase